MNTGTSKAEDIKLQLNRVFDAPRDLVFRAWTDPSQFQTWFGAAACGGSTLQSVKMDVRAGGKYRLKTRRPDGEYFTTVGTYREVKAPERLVFTWQFEKDGSGDEFGEVEPPETLVTVEFKARGQQTELVLTHEQFASPESRDRHQDGWGRCVAALGNFVVDGKPLDGVGPLIVERTFDASADRIWKAITDPKEMGEWYFEVPAFKAEVGREFRFVVEHEGNTYDHRCKVTEVVPQKKLAYSWRYDGYEGDSLVTFELFAEGAKTKLKLTHSGLENFPKTPQFARKNFLGGWTSLIGESLPNYLEKH